MAIGNMIIILFYCHSNFLHSLLFQCSNLLHSNTCFISTQINALRNLEIPRMRATLLNDMQSIECRTYVSHAYLGILTETWMKNKDLPTHTLQTGMIKWEIHISNPCWVLYLGMDPELWEGGFFLWPRPLLLKNHTHIFMHSLALIASFTRKLNSYTWTLW